MRGAVGVAAAMVVAGVAACSDRAGAQHSALELCVQISADYASVSLPISDIRLGTATPQQAAAQIDALTAVLDRQAQTARSEHMEDVANQLVALKAPVLALGADVAAQNLSAETADLSTVFHAYLNAAATCRRTA